MIVLSDASEAIGGTSGAIRADRNEPEDHGWQARDPWDARAGRNDLAQTPRAADLIGQLGDPHYLRKSNALYYEFEETGLNRQFGYELPADLFDKYPQFYWNSVFPHIQEGSRYLNVTSSGRQWIAGLYSNVFRAERDCGSPGRSHSGADAKLVLD